MEMCELHTLQMEQKDVQSEYNAAVAGVVVAVARWTKYVPGYVLIKKCKARAVENKKHKIDDKLRALHKTENRSIGKMSQRLYEDREGARHLK